MDFKDAAMVHQCEGPRDGEQCSYGEGSEFVILDYSKVIPQSRYFCEDCYMVYKRETFEKDLDNSRGPAVKSKT